MCIFLSVGQIGEVVADLTRHYVSSAATVAVVANATWPEQRVVRCTLADIAGQVSEEGIGKTAMIVVVTCSPGPGTLSPLSHLLPRLPGGNGGEA